MRAGVVNEEVVSDVDLRQKPVHRELVVIFAQRARHIVHVVPERILLAEHRNMVIGAVHGRPHQVRSTRVYADIFLVDMLLMDRLGDQRTVRRQHETPHLAVDRDVIHPVCLKDRVIDLPDTFSDHSDVIWHIIRRVSHAYAAGQVDERDVYVKCAADLQRQLEQLRGEHRIILVGHSITREEGMDAKMFHTLFLKDPHALEQLLLGKSVLGITGVIHDPIGHPEHAARVIAKAHRLRELTAEDIFQERNVRDVIKVDDRSELCRKRVFLRRCVVGGEHDVRSVRSYGIREHQFRHRGAVKPKIIVVKDLHDRRVRRRFDGKILTEPGIPGKCRFDSFRILTDPLLIVQIKGCGPCLCDLFYLFFGDIGYFFHVDLRLILITGAYFSHHILRVAPIVSIV